jgi:hypothetical protein
LARLLLKWVWATNNQKFPRLPSVSEFSFDVSVVYFVPFCLTDDTYLLTPWSRVLLEKLTGFADSREIPRIYGTRKFITVLTSAHHLSLS